MEFVVLPYKDYKDVFILGGTDDIQVLLDDSNINIQTIASSRHVGPIKPRVEEWLKNLDLFGKTLVRGFFMFCQTFVEHFASCMCICVWRKIVAFGFNTCMILKL